MRPPIPPIEKWDGNLEEEEEEDWDTPPPDSGKLTWDNITLDYSSILTPEEEDAEREAA